MLLDHLINLRHQADRLSKRDDDLLVMGDIFGGQLPPAPVFQPFVAHLVAYKQEQAQGFIARFLIRQLFSLGEGQLSILLGSVWPDHLG